MNFQWRSRHISFKTLLTWFTLFARSPLSTRVIRPDIIINSVSGKVFLTDSASEIISSACFVEVSLLLRLLVPTCRISLWLLIPTCTQYSPLQEYLLYVKQILGLLSAPASIFRAAWIFKPYIWDFHDGRFSTNRARFWNI
jgi:hypothetical protein